MKMLPIPKNLQDKLKIDPKQENNEFQLHGQVICNCGCDEFKILYFGKEEEDYIMSKKFDGIWLLVIHLICKHCNNKFLLFCNELYGWDGFVCNYEIHNKVNELLQNFNYKQTICDECNNIYYNIFISISSQGKDDFVEGLSDEIEQGIFLEADWVNAYDWITINTKCTKCGIETEYVDYETA